MWLDDEEHQKFRQLWLTNEEWEQIDYLITVLEPLRSYTLWMSKVKGPTIQQVFTVYEQIFEHLEDQVQLLSRKRKQWKVEVREACYAALAKAKVYYSQTHFPKDTLPSLGHLLDPTKKLEMMKGWDEIEGNDPSSAESYTQQHRRKFIDYYQNNYAPSSQKTANSQTSRESTPMATGNMTAAQRKRMLRITGARSATPVPAGTQDVCEATAYIDSPVTATESMSLAEHEQYLRNGNRLLTFWKSEAENRRRVNLCRMARDVLAVPAASVGVERAFNVSRDQMDYRRMRMTAETLRESMITKYYHRKEINEEIIAWRRLECEKRVQDAGSEAFWCPNMTCQRPGRMWRT